MRKPKQKVFNIDNESFKMSFFFPKIESNWKQSSERKWIWHIITKKNKYVIYTHWQYTKSPQDRKKRLLNVNWSYARKNIAVQNNKDKLVIDFLAYWVKFAKRARSNHQIWILFSFEQIDKLECAKTKTLQSLVDWND